MSTSWTCDDSDNWNGDCKLIYDLFWHRHIKEVKIGKLCHYCSKFLQDKTCGNNWTDDGFILSFQFPVF